MIYEILARIWARSKQQIHGDVNTGLTGPQVDVIKLLTSNGLTRVQTTNVKANISLYHLTLQSFQWRKIARQKASVLETDNDEHIENVYTNMADKKCTQVIPCLLQKAYIGTENAERYAVHNV